MMSNTSLKIFRDFKPKQYQIKNYCGRSHLRGVVAARCTFIIIGKTHYSTTLIAIYFFCMLEMLIKLSVDLPVHNSSLNCEGEYQLCGTFVFPKIKVVPNIIFFLHDE